MSYIKNNISEVLVKIILEYINANEKVLLSRTNKYMKNYITKLITTRSTKISNHNTEKLGQQTKISIQEEEILSINYFVKKMSLLKYLYSYGPWNELVCKSIAKNGKLKYLRYAHENDCPWDEETCTSAASVGSLKCLKYAHENGCPWDEGTCVAAVEYGSLECLKYAHENGCPWNEEVCETAASNGNLDCLKYACENKCPWGEWVYFNAAAGGHLECFVYACENGCPWNILACYAVSTSYIDDIDFLKYVYEKGCHCEYNIEIYEKIQEQINNYA